MEEGGDGGSTWWRPGCAASINLSSVGGGTSSHVCMLSRLLANSRCVCCAGAPGAANGLMSELFGVKSGPLLQRSNIIIGLAAFACLPLVSIR